jgi:hypothetical protein
MEGQRLLQSVPLDMGGDEHGLGRDLLTVDLSDPRSAEVRVHMVLQV